MRFHRLTSVADCLIEQRKIYYDAQRQSASFRPIEPASVNWPISARVPPSRGISMPSGPALGCPEQSSGGSEWGELAGLLTAEAPFPAPCQQSRAAPWLDPDIAPS
jgi:hypothetical protein